MKKLMSFLLVAAACASMAVTAMADGVEMRVPSCPNCGGHLNYINHYEEINKDPVFCYRGGEEHIDVIYTYEVTEGYECSDCPYSNLNTYEDENRVCPKL